MILEVLKVRDRFSRYTKFREAHGVITRYVRVWLWGVELVVRGVLKVRDRCFRYKKFHGKFLVHPITGRRMPIVQDSEVHSHGARPVHLVIMMIK